MEREHGERGNPASAHPDKQIWGPFDMTSLSVRTALIQSIWLLEFHTRTIGLVCTMDTVRADIRSSSTRQSS